MRGRKECVDAGECFVCGGVGMSNIFGWYGVDWLDGESR